MVGYGNMRWRDRSLFLKWALINALYLLALGVGRATYHGHIHSIGLIAIVLVLVDYAAASGYAGWLCWRGGARGVDHVWLGFSLAPKLAMMGTVGGFLLAFGSSASDVQGRVLGASTGLAATFVGLTVLIVLELVGHLIEQQ